MRIVKRVKNNLKYSPSRRHMQLDETRFGPILKLIFAFVGFVAFALLMIYVIVPALIGWFSGIPQSYPWNAASSSAAEPTAEPLHPILSNTVETISFGDAWGAQVVVDPSVYNNEVLFATGPDMNHCDRLMRLDPTTGESDSIEVPHSFDTLRYPREDANSILYIDGKTVGGGVIRMMDKKSGKAKALYELATGAPRIFYETPYLTWIERMGEDTSKLYVCDVATGESLTVASFTNSPYMASAPSIKSGQVLYADADPHNETHSLIRTMLLKNGSRWDYAAGMYVHDPKSVGDRWAWMTGDHGENSDLYLSVQGGSPQLVARGIIDFFITPTCVVYNRSETVFAYVFMDNKTYVLSETSHNSQLVTAEGDYAIWRDMTDPAFPIWKYIRVV